MIDQASVFAERYKSDPRILQATVLGQGNVPGLDPYTALNALRLIKESNAMQMANQAQQPTSSPSIVSENMTPPPSQLGLGAMIPGTMGQGAPQGPQGAPQGPQMGQAPQGAPQGQAPVMQASGGLAGMHTPEESYAAGGIVAFDEGGATDSNEEGWNPTGSTDMRVSDSDLGLEGEGNAGLQERAFANYESSRKALMDMQDTGLDRDEDKAVRQDYMDLIAKNAGPDIYGAANTRLDKREADRAKNLSQGQGLAMLAAAGAILEGNTLARGASKAFPVFAKEMGEVQRADQGEQRSIETMKFSLADAQRKERMGDIRGAQAAAETARKAKSDANRFSLGKNKALADLDAKALQATRTTGKGAGGAGGTKLAEQLGAAEIAYRNDPSPQNKRTVEALRSAVSQTKTSFSTGEIGPNRAAVTLAPVQQRIDAKVTDSMKSFPTMNPAYRKAMRNKDTEEAQRLWDAEEARWRKIHSQSENAAGGGGGDSGSKRSGSGGRIAPPAGFTAD